MALMAGRPSPELLTRGQFHERVLAGEYDDVRVVLEQGRVIEIPPGGPPHAMAVTRLYGLLTRALPPTMLVRQEQGWAASDLWNDLSGHEPQPDLAVVTEGTYVSDHPGVAETLVLIEVADTSQRNDRRQVLEYGRDGVRESWLIDLAARTITVYRDPDPVDGYRSIEIHRSGEEVDLLGVSVRMDDFAPDL